MGGLERVIALGAAMVLDRSAAAGDRAVSLLVISLGRLDLAHVAFIAKVIILRHFWVTGVTRRV
jgi:hypothetical protein